MNVHVINLKEAVDRKKSIIAQLDKLGLAFEIFDAIKGSSLNEDEYNSMVDISEVSKYPNWLTPNLIGCTLSHLGVYRRILDSNCDWHLVLEDDVLLGEQVLQIMTHVEKNESLYKGHVLLFYAISIDGFVELSKTPIDAINSYHVHQVLSKDDIGGAGAYIIHKEVARKILAVNSPVKVANDTWQYFLEKNAISQIDCIFPFAAQPALFESTIGYINVNSLRYRVKKFVETYKIPLFHNWLRHARKRVWKKTSKVKFM